MNNKFIFILLAVVFLMGGVFAASISGMVVSVRDQKSFSFQEKNFDVAVSKATSTGEADIEINGEKVSGVEEGDVIAVDGAEIEVKEVKKPNLFRRGYNVELGVKEVEEAEQTGEIIPSINNVVPKSVPGTGTDSCDGDDICETNKIYVGTVNPVQNTMLHIEDNSVEAKSILKNNGGFAWLQILAGGDKDPYISFQSDNQKWWSLGIDKSEGETFKIVQSSGLGGFNEFFEIDTEGVLKIDSLQIGDVTPVQNTMLHIEDNSVEAKSILKNNGGFAWLQLLAGDGKDPFISFQSENGLWWSTGIDKSDGEKFKITQSSGLGNSNNVLEFDSNGDTTLNSLTGTGNAYVCVDSTGKLYRSSTACA